MSSTANLALSLPDDLKAFVDAEAAAGGYDDAGAFVRDVLRALRDHKKEEGKALLELKVLDALESGSPIGATPQFWTDLKERVRRRQSGGSPP